MSKNRNRYVDELVNLAKSNGMKQTEAVRYVNTVVHSSPLCTKDTFTGRWVQLAIEAGWMNVDGLPCPWRVQSFGNGDCCMEVHTPKVFPAGHPRSIQNAQQYLNFLANGGEVFEETAYGFDFGYRVACIAFQLGVDELDDMKSGDLHPSDYINAEYGFDATSHTLSGAPSNVKKWFVVKFDKGYDPGDLRDADVKNFKYRVVDRLGDARF